MRRFNPRKILAFVLGLAWAMVVALAATAAGEQPSRLPLEERPPLRVGSDVASYPYSFLDDDGRLQGFGVDLFDAVARTMNLKIHRIVKPNLELLDMFQRGEIDVLQSFSRTPTREALAEFSVPYLIAQVVVVVRKDDRTIHSLSDLKGREVVLITVGSIGEKLLADREVGARIVYLSSTNQALHELNAGQHDAVIAGRYTAQALIQQFNLRHIVQLGEPVEGYEISYSFGVRKGDAALLARLNEALALVNRSGEYNRINRKWFGRFENGGLSRQEATTLAAAVLALSLLATLLVLRRQRTLHRRIARQAARLAESEAILAEAQQVAHLGHWRYAPAAAVPITWSEETFRMFECPPEGKPLSYPEMLARFVSESREALADAVQRALAEGAAFELRLALETTPKQRKILHASGRPIRDAAGNIIAVFGTLQDLSGQLAVEDALRRQARLLRALYDNVPIAMGVIECTTNKIFFVSANPETTRLLGRPGRLLAGQALSELELPAAVAEFWQTQLRRLPEGRDVSHFDVVQERTRRHYTVTLVALESESAGDLRRCFLIGDVTERRQMDAEIAQGRKLRAVGELVGGIAHEFNNLLTPILLNAEAIGFDLPAKSPLQDDLGVIRQAAERATELTRRLLNFGRRSDSRAEAVGLIAMVSNTFQLLRPTIDRRIRLESELPAELAPLFLNPTDLHQILLNLLLNARDTLMEKLAGAAGEDWTPMICVSAEGFGPEAKPVVGENRRGPPQAWQRLTVRDNGLGMPPAVLERIFEPFFTTKEVGKGTGLGLATVWHLATALGGSVEVESVPGLGTAFHVWLPVWPVPATTAMPVGGAPVQKSAGQGVRILLVEDDDLVAQTVLAALRMLGHETQHIAHGAEGWEHLRASLDRYHLLLCDLNMPGLSGVELIRRAREAKFGGAILVMSGRLTDEDTQALKRCRVEKIIAKPFTIAAFQAAVAACLAQGK